MSKRKLISISIKYTFEMEEIFNLKEIEQNLNLAEGECLEQLDRVLVNLRQACQAVIDGNSNAWAFVDKGGRELLADLNAALADGIPVPAADLILTIGTLACV